MGGREFLADGNFGGSCAALTLVDLPIAFPVESHLQKTVPGVVALAAAGADQVAAPGRALAIVVLGHGEGRATTAGDEEHAEGAFGSFLHTALWNLRSLTTPEKRLRSG